MGLQGDAVAHVGDGGACGLCMGVWGGGNQVTLDVFAARLLC